MTWARITRKGVPIPIHPVTAVCPGHPRVAQMITSAMARTTKIPPPTIEATAPRRMERRLDRCALGDSVLSTRVSAFRRPHTPMAMRTAANASATSAEEIIRDQLPSRSTLGYGPLNGPGLLPALGPGSGLSYSAPTVFFRGDCTARSLTWARIRA